MLSPCRSPRCRPKTATAIGEQPLKGLPGDPASCDPLCGTMDDRLAMVLELGTLDDDLHELKERHGRGIVEVDDIDAALSKIRCKIKEVRIAIAHARNALLDTDASIRFHRWDTERALGMGR